MGTYIKLFQTTEERLAYESGDYIEPYVSLTLNDVTYSAKMGPSENLEVTHNSDGTYTIIDEFGSYTVTSTNCLMAYLYDVGTYHELSSEGKIDGQDTTVIIDNVTYYGRWRNGFGWSLYDNQEYDGMVVGILSRVTITEHQNGQLAKYNKTKLATLTLTTGDTVEIKGYYKENPVLTKEMIDPYRESLSEIVIHEAVYELGDYIFQNCTNLTNITISDNVEKVGYNSFANCTNLPVVGNIRYADTYAIEVIDKSLSSYTIKDGTKWIQSSMFKNCTSLTEVNIPNSVKYIGYRSFEGCTNLTNIILPNNLTSIESSIFYNCTGLTSIVIPDSVTYIGTYAFSRTSLVNVSIPGNVKSIANGAFSYCSNLTSVDIQDGVERTDVNVFSNCTALTSIFIPSSVNNISNGLLEECTNISSIIVDPDNPTYDSRNNCNAIIETATNKLIQGCKNTVIPNSVTSIGSYAFYGISTLTSINIPNSITDIGWFAFDECTGLTNIVIPDSVTHIDNCVFYQCTNLTNVTLSSNLTEIGTQAFAYCSKLNSITSRATTAPTIEAETFRNVKTRGTLTVPQGATGYDVWMGTGNYYLGKYSWTKVEQQ